MTSEEDQQQNPICVYYRGPGEENLGLPMPLDDMLPVTDKGRSERAAALERAGASKEEALQIYRGLPHCFQGNYATDPRFVVVPDREGREAIVMSYEIEVEGPNVPSSDPAPDLSDDDLGAWKEYIRHLGPTLVSLGRALQSLALAGPRSRVVLHARERLLRAREDRLGIAVELPVDLTAEEYAILEPALRATRWFPPSNHEILAAEAQLRFLIPDGAAPLGMFPGTALPLKEGPM